ncbi:MAG: PHP domain-containing protein [SAR202 cluster bacterium]|nr:PHP domain-containing protein [SAR202 cluster bacterium]
MLIDIHTHTYPTSDDSSLSPEELIIRSKQLGLDGICITDHDGFWDPKDVTQLGKIHDFLVIPGCEVTTEEGHILVYGLEKYIFGMHKSAFVKELVDEAKGAMVIAHPYRRVYRENAPQDPDTYNEMIDRGLRNKAFSLVDAVEIKNGRGTLKENEFSKNLAARLKMPSTGASDAHKLSDIGTYATYFENNIKNLEDFILAIKSGKYYATNVKEFTLQTANS